MNVYSRDEDAFISSAMAATPPKQKARKSESDAGIVKVTTLQKSEEDDEGKSSDEKKDAKSKTNSAQSGWGLKHPGSGDSQVTFIRLSPFTAPSPFPFLSLC